MLNNKIPLVTVGMPSYNKPEGVRKTLGYITNQTYSNLEIIISDNNSVNKKEIVAVVNEFKKSDNRIKCHLQEENIGPFLNFNFLLKQAKGDYFMWAADDDQWENFYIEECLNEFLRNKDQNIAAVNTEAQYFFGEELFDLIPEGKPFYSRYDSKKIGRLMYMTEHHYGNLFYSLYKKEYLFDNEGKTFLEQSKSYTLNELPLYLLVAQKGQWRVLPKIGFRKSAPKRVYERVKWENSDKIIPAPNTKHTYNMLDYYLEGIVLGIYELFKVTEKLSITEKETEQLKIKVTQVLWKKFEYYLPYSPQRINWSNDNSEDYIAQLKIKFDEDIKRRYIDGSVKYNTVRKLRLKIKKYLKLIYDRL